MPALPQPAPALRQPERGLFASILSEEVRVIMVVRRQHAKVLEIKWMDEESAR